MKRAVMAAALVLITACGQIEVSGGLQGGDPQKSDGGPIELAVIPKSVGLNFWEQVRIGAECAVSKQENVTMQWDGVTTEVDVTGQFNLLQNVITQGVDGLVYAALDAAVMTQISQLALEQGIEVTNIDSGTDPQLKQVPLYATDNIVAARKVADLLAEEIGPKGGEVAFLPFQPGSGTNDDRAKGFKQGLKEHPELKLVDEQTTQSDYNIALNVTENILTAHPGLDGIFAANEGGVLGAAEAVRRADKAGDIAMIGWDASPDEIAAVKEGVVSVLVTQNPFKMGYEGVNAALQLIRTGKTPKSEETGTYYITKDNVNDPKIKSVYDPSCQDPPLFDD